MGGNLKVGRNPSVVPRAVLDLLGAMAEACAQPPRPKSKPEGFNPGRRG